MKNTYILIVFLFSIGVSAQNVIEINADLKLADSLTYKKEIRIYKGGGITNYTSLFRMFKDKTKKWVVEFYQHYSKAKTKAKLHTKKRILKPKKDLEFTFQNLIRSHVLDLPSEEKIQWKLGTRSELKKIETIHKGKVIKEYHSTTGKKHILDGESFYIQAKGYNLIHEFKYSNPDAYLAYYPHIDELIYMSEILNIIRSEFEIWGK